MSPQLLYSFNGQGRLAALQCQSLEFAAPDDGAFVMADEARRRSEHAAAERSKAAVSVSPRSVQSAARPAANMRVSDGQGRGSRL